MSIQILIDMNLSPDWLPHFQSAGYHAVHWSSVGAHDADDLTIMDWARKNQFVVFTHDLDFGTCLALTSNHGPSVFQIRAQDVMPQSLSSVVIDTIRQHEVELTAGALIVLDRVRARVRLLPLRTRGP